MINLTYIEIYVNFHLYGVANKFPEWYYCVT
jgi:hypothetical protein